MTSYLQSNNENIDLITVTARLLLDLLPGLDTSQLFADHVNFFLQIIIFHVCIPRLQNEVIKDLYGWTERADEPLRSYATGLLAAVLEIGDFATANRDRNIHLVPILLFRLHDLWDLQLREIVVCPSLSQQQTSSSSLTGLSDFRCLLSDDNEYNSRGRSLDIGTALPSSSNARIVNGHVSPVKDRAVSPTKSYSPSVEFSSTIRKRKIVDEGVSEETTRIKRPLAKKARFDADELSNSSWAELAPYVVGEHRIFPLNTVMQQRFILQLLYNLGEYQEVNYY